MTEVTPTYEHGEENASSFSCWCRYGREVGSSTVFPRPNGRTDVERMLELAPQDAMNFLSVVQGRSSLRTQSACTITKPTRNRKPRRSMHPSGACPNAQLRGDGSLTLFVSQIVGLPCPKTLVRGQARLEHRLSIAAKINGVYP